MRSYPLLLILGMNSLLADPVSTPRQEELRELIHQDCGSCHGMNLTGGLGPAITQQALKNKSHTFLKNTIRDGRPGTPMPPWKNLLSEMDIEWITNYLKQGGVKP